MPPVWLGTSAYAVNALVTYAEAGPTNPFWYVLKCISPVSAAPPNTSNPPPITTFNPVVVNTANWVLQNPGEPAYVIGTVYLPGDVVSFGGAADGANPPLYLCLVETAASPGAQPSSWKALSTAGDAPGATTVSAIAASGITVTQPSAGNYFVSAELGTAAGSGVTVAAGAGNAKNLSVNLTTADGCGITKSPSVGDTSLGLALNLSAGAGLLLSPSTVPGNTNTALKLNLGPGSGYSGTWLTNGVNSNSAGTTAVVPTVIAGAPVYANAVIMVTPNTPLRDATLTPTILTWYLYWNPVGLSGVWTLIIDQATSTQNVTFTYVVLSTGTPPT